MIFIWMLVLAAICGTAYHMMTKMLPDLHQPFASLCVTYFMGAIICFLLLVFFCGFKGVVPAFAALDIKSFLIGIALVGVETGIYFLYKAGSAITVTPLLLSSAQTVLTLLIGLLLFREELSAVNLAGIFLCLAGSYLAVRK
jgi:drug/metabolite transporter (DMT)-like permease